MPKQIQSDELDSVLRVVASFRSGVAFEKIAEALEPRLSRRTLQRRLARLVSQKRLLLNFALGTGQISKRVKYRSDRYRDGLNLGGVARGLKEVLIRLVLVLYLTVFKQGLNDEMMSDSVPSMSATFSGRIIANRQDLRE